MDQNIFKNFIDISPLISEKTAIYPGDVPYSRNIAMSFAQKHHLELSSITTTLHIGAHTDAPSHYHGGAKTMEQRDLSFYMGECQVLSVDVPLGQLIKPEDVSEVIKAKRILFKTNSFPNPNEYNQDFVAISPELIIKLKSVGVVLVGIDTPSVDPSNSKEMLAHKAIYQSDMAILEGIILKNVADGIYQLIALPLKLSGADASPVRAILLEE
jgi:arylformamidase